MILTLARNLRKKRKRKGMGLSSRYSEEKKIDEYVTLYALEQWEKWSPKYIYLGEIRHTFCPACSKSIPWNEEIVENACRGIGQLKPLFKCGQCGTKLRYDIEEREWLYEFDKDNKSLAINVCPDCLSEISLPHDTLPKFYICTDCDIEFRYDISPTGDGLLCTKFKQGERIRMTSKRAMNDKYANPDPFGVMTNPDDKIRKDAILSVCQSHIDLKRDGRKFKRALDIGCGEGFITKDLPADEIVAYDISDVALSRLEGENIIVTDSPARIDGEFDLILLAGVLVREYEFQHMLDIVERHATELVVTCQTDVTEVSDVRMLTGKQGDITEFSYLENKQRLRIFDFSVAKVETEPEPGGADDGEKSPGDVQSDAESETEPIKINDPIDVNVVDIDPITETQVATDTGVIPDPSVGDAPTDNKESESEDTKRNF